jgi:hypothetical protein
MTAIGIISRPRAPSMSRPAARGRWFEFRPACAALVTGRLTEEGPKGLDYTARASILGKYNRIDTKAAPHIRRGIAE